jgi:transcriptional regulator with AAA-type ATPase domain
VSDHEIADGSWDVQRGTDLLSDRSRGVLMDVRRGSEAEPRLVGRERELSILRRLLRGAEDESGRHVLVLGDAGIGKSRLLEEAIAATSRSTALLDDRS